MKYEPDLSTKIALVTGASSGIGRAIARSLAARGVLELHLVARRRERLEALAKELGPKARVQCCDLSSEAERKALLRRVPAVDLLVNAAGFSLNIPFDEQVRVDAKSLTQLVQVNCEAPVHLTSAWVLGMIARGQGWVLNVGSIAGDFPVPSAAIYGASKAFINSFTESLESELRGQNVPVHLLAPGPVATELFDARGDNHYFKPPALLFAHEAKVAEAGVHALLAGKRRLTPGIGARAMSLLMKCVPRRLFLSVSAYSISRQRRARAK